MIKTKEFAYDLPEVKTSVNIKIKYSLNLGADSYSDIQSEYLDDFKDNLKSEKIKELLQDVKTTEDFKHLLNKIINVDIMVASCQ